jgi:hypothetical protein
MARLLRIHVIEGSYHGTGRGNGGETLSRRDDDRRALLGWVSGMPDRFGAEVHAVVWMEHHDLLLLRCRRTDASETRGSLQTRYPIWFKGAHRRPGHVFQGRFKPVLIQKAAMDPEKAVWVVVAPARRARPDEQEILSAAASIRGRSWWEMCERHGDWGRDGLVAVATRHLGWRLVEVAGEMPA